MPYADASFDSAYMLHVGMNIMDKPALFSEVNRVLRPNAMFAVYDVMRTQQGDLTSPVPWASEVTNSHLASQTEYVLALEEAGFKVELIINRREFALEVFDNARQQNEKNAAPAPLGLHTLMQASAGEKLHNMVQGIKARLIAPIEIIVSKT